MASSLLPLDFSVLSVYFLLNICLKQTRKNSTESVILWIIVQWYEGLLVYISTFPLTSVCESNMMALMLTYLHLLLLTLTFAHVCICLAFLVTKKKLFGPFKRLYLFPMLCGICPISWCHMKYRLSLWIQIVYPCSLSRLSMASLFRNLIIYSHLKTFCNTFGKQNYV